MEAILGPVLLGKNGNQPTSCLRDAKYLLLYFSAHWCPPCRGFTPKLGLFYDSVNSAHKQVEIVYVSGDRTPEQFAEYYDEMPWLAVPYSESATRNELAQRFRVQGIPSLMLINHEGVVKKDACRMDVTNKGPLCLADWDAALNS
ncbi:unnamed protein product [Blepharisma stoltei]|uniref:Thioredoxin domain-containing protein n=1 Tax=Blepharisma stoltei TaxID=1481888 RepID=A0AAU9JNV3_9CILI|nr:unnamed protein product [Blepharisma stoltei]